MTAKFKNKSTKESRARINRERTTPEEKLEVWGLILRTEPWTPELAKTFCSKVGGMYGLTEEQVATHPLVLKFLHQIREWARQRLEQPMTGR